MRRLIVILGLLMGVLCASHPAEAKYWGSAPNPNLTVMDPYAGKWQQWCGAYRFFSKWTGPLYTVMRQTDGATEDVYPGYSQWPDPVLLQSWSQGSQLFVTKCYDQTGNGNTWVLPSGNQPVVDLNGAHPLFHLNGDTQWFEPPALNSAINGAAGLTAVMIGAKDTSDVTAPYAELALSTSASATAAQMAILMDGAVANADICEGRRQTTDGLYRSTTNTALFPPDTNWHVWTCNFAYQNAVMTYQRDNGTLVTKTGFSTPGSAPAANGLRSDVGSFFGNNPWSGWISGFGIAQTSLSAGLATAWTTALAYAQPSVAPAQLPFLWGNNPRLTTTITTQAPGIVLHVVETPDGSTPSMADLNSLQYRHHTRVAYHNGRTWIANSANQNIETDAGIGTYLISSPDHWATNTGVEWAFPPQSAWGDNSSAARGVLPRAFVVYGGNLYLTGQISTAYGGGQGGLVLVAVQCNDDGSLGTPFIIAPNAGVAWASYTANPGYPQYAFNPFIGPALYALSDVYGQYDDGGANDPWHGVLAYGGASYCERGVVPLDTTGQNLAIVYRVCSGLGLDNSFVALTNNGDKTESAPVRSTIIGGSVPVTGALLPNGEDVLIGNAWTSRNSQYLATFTPSTGKLNAVYETAGCTTLAPLYTACTPLYPAGGKSGGPSYGGLWVDTADGLLLGSFSFAKESVVEFEVPLSGL